MKSNTIYLILALLLLAGCASKPINEAPQLTKVLVITGEGLNTSFKDDPKASSFLFSVGSDFAEHLTEDLKVLGAKPQLFLLKDANTRPIEMVRKLLQKNEQDGLIQVIVKKYNKNNELHFHLEAEYLPLLKVTLENGSTQYTFGKGFKERYNLMSKNKKEFSKTTPKQMANNFAKKLKRNGLISK